MNERAEAPEKLSVTPYEQIEQRGTRHRRGHDGDHDTGSLEKRLRRTNGLITEVDDEEVSRQRQPDAHLLHGQQDEQSEESIATEEEAEGALQFSHQLGTPPSADSVIFPGII